MVLHDGTESYFITSSPFTSLPLKPPTVAFLEPFYCGKLGCGFPPHVRLLHLQNGVSGAAPHWREICSFISPSLNCSSLRKLPHLGYWPLYLHICNSNYLYLDSFACHALVNTAHTGGTECTCNRCCAVPGKGCSNGGRFDPSNTGATCDIDNSWIPFRCAWYRECWLTSI